MSAALWLFKMQHKTPPAATLSCRTGLLREDAPESVLPQQARQDILYDSGRLAPYAGGGAS